MFLLVLGVYVLIRFLFMFKIGEQKNNISLSRKKAVPLGLIAGFADATGGGGWGPIATPVLLSKTCINSSHYFSRTDAFFG